MPIVTLSTSPSLAVNPNLLRKSVVFHNTDSSINIFIKKERGNDLAVTSTNYDHKLGPGDGIGLTVDDDGEEATQHRWTAIAASGTPILSVTENEKIRR